MPRIPPDTDGQHTLTPEEAGWSYIGFLVRRIGLRDTFGESGPNEALLEKYGLTARHVAAAARELLNALGGRPR